MSGVICVSWDFNAAGEYIIIAWPLELLELN